MYSSPLLASEDREGTGISPLRISAPSLYRRRELRPGCKYRQTDSITRRVFGRLLRDQRSPKYRYSILYPGDGDEGRYIYLAISLVCPISLFAFFCLLIFNLSVGQLRGADVLNFMAARPIFPYGIAETA